MAVIPRLASTVVLMDSRSNVYLTKRPETMKFFGGYYVFPGGAVEPADNAIGEAYLKKVKQEENFPLAHYVAAAREVFEEVGVLLCYDDDGFPAALPQEKRRTYRRQLIRDEIPFSEILEKERLHLNLDSFIYFGHLVTPENNPIRFDTRFFLAKLPEGQTVKPDEEEIAAAAWFSPEEAFESFQAGSISLPPPTILALKTIMEAKAGAPLMMPGIDALKEWIK